MWTQFHYEERRVSQRLLSPREKSALSRMIRSAVRKELNRRYVPPAARLEDLADSAALLATVLPEAPADKQPVQSQLFCLSCLHDHSPSTECSPEHLQEITL